LPSLDYKPPGPVARSFLKDWTSFVRGLMGPVGGGKSVACCIAIIMAAMNQKPDKQKRRRTKWVVIRNTNAQLKTTTIATWLDWFPSDDLVEDRSMSWGEFIWTPPYTHYIKFPMGDKTTVECEVIFLALDRPEDVKKLLSLEVTGAWLNEARELPKAIVDGATMRVGRFPSMKDGGPTWYGVIMDTNAPEEDHWWPIMSGDVPPPPHMTAEDLLMMQKPDNWRFYRQPGAMVEIKNEDGEVTGYEMSPEAENAANLTPSYYLNLIRGKLASWIKVYVLNRYGSAEDGKAVYEGWNEKVHLAREPLRPAPGILLQIGMDFGLTPAAVIAQRLPNGRWLILEEIVAGDMGAQRFGKHVKAYLEANYPGLSTKFTGDPAGDFRAQTDEVTPFEILRAVGIQAYPAESNDPVVRIEAVNGVLGRMVDGNPGFLIDGAKCPVLVAGFNGGYHYRRLQVSGEHYDNKPNKNKYSHPHDALQYLMLGGGEGRIIKGREPGHGKPVVADRRGGVWEWAKRKRLRGGK
jgi:hypothetical protein